MRFSAKGKSPMRSPANRGEPEPSAAHLAAEVSGVPLQYWDMVHEVRQEAGKTGERPLKKRKALRESMSPSVGDEDLASGTGSTPASDPTELLDDEEGDDESTESSDEEVEWEELNLIDHDTISKEHNEASKESEKPEKTVVIGVETQAVVAPKRTKQILSREEKHQRKIVHKMHLICLLHHASVRNRWYNDYEVRKAYRHFLGASVVQELYPAAHLSDTLKTRKFLDGLRHAANAWGNKFIVSSSGLQMLGWRSIFDMNRKIDSRMSRKKFRNRLLKFSGSRDLSAQGFCALLRAVDIDARLVCSLQPLDFHSNDPIATQEELMLNTEQQQTSQFPTYWVEAWNPHGEKWVTVDPSVTGSVDIVRRSSRVEPPFGDVSNSMRYVVAFDVLNHARDVTRRYASQYNAKTRKRRITTTPDGAKWWNKALSVYEPRSFDPRDIAEILELEKREATEPIPTSIQDFKGHPLYVLEQHLKQNEVLDPKEKCGFLALKSTKSQERRSFPIYKRDQVKVVRSSHTWYRLGRVVKPTCQPLKHGKPRSRHVRKRSLSSDEEEEPNVALYAIEQTEIYRPPPVVDGVIPKNAFGKIDVFVESMVPAGACHLRFRNIASAAKLIGVNYADAVVGFEYSRRQTTSKINGIVVANEHRAAIMAVYGHLLNEQLEVQRRATEAQALLRWRKYLAALRIRERLNRVHGIVSKPTIEQEEANSDQSGKAEGKENPEKDTNNLLKGPWMQPDNFVTVDSSDSDSGIEIITTKLVRARPRTSRPTTVVTAPTDDAFTNQRNISVPSPLPAPITATNQLSHLGVPQRRTAVPDVPPAGNASKQVSLSSEEAYMAESMSESELLSGDDV